MVLVCIQFESTKRIDIVQYIDNSVKYFDTENYT